MMEGAVLRHMNPITEKVNPMNLPGSNAYFILGVKPPGLSRMIERNGCHPHIDDWDRGLRSSPLVRRAQGSGSSQRLGK